MSHDISFELQQIKTILDKLVEKSGMTADTSSQQQQFRVNLITLTDKNATLHAGYNLIADVIYTCTYDIDWNKFTYNHRVHVDLKTPNVNAFLLQDLIKHLIRSDYVIEFEDGLSFVKKDGSRQ